MVHWHHVLLCVCFGTSVSAVQTPDCPSAKVIVVYNALVWPDNNWKLLIGSQLRQLKETGLADCASVHVVLSAPAVAENFPHQEVEDMLKEAKQLAQDTLPKRHRGQIGSATVSQLHENSFEYPGLYLLWSLAQEMEVAAALNTIFLYIHSKGMVHHGYLNERSVIEVALFNSTVNPWQQAVAIFESNRTVTRVGPFPAPGGWLWHNFWWARASYLQTLVEPVRVTRRHYYEEWLGRLDDPDSETAQDYAEGAEPGKFADCLTCYSLNGLCGGPARTYAPEETVAFLLAGITCNLSS